MEVLCLPQFFIAIEIHLFRSLPLSFLAPKLVCSGFSLSLCSLSPPRVVGQGHALGMTRCRWRQKEMDNLQKRPPASVISEGRKNKGLNAQNLKQSA